MPLPALREYEAGAWRWYERNGEVYVSVTSAIGAMSSLLREEAEPGLAPSLLKQAAIEGTYCHAVALGALGARSGLFETPGWPAHEVAGLGPQRAVLLGTHAERGALAWLAALEVEVINIEAAGVATGYGFAGRPDLQCILTHRGRRVPAVVDFKFVRSLVRTHSLQVRAYGRLDEYADCRIGALVHINKETGEFVHRAVYLQDDPQSMAAFLSCVNLLQWMRQIKP